MNHSTFSEEKFKKLVAFLIAFVTVLITLAAYLQNDASNRDDTANRDTKRYSMEAMGLRVSGDARANFDYNRAYQAYYEYELLIASAEVEGDEAAVARYTELQAQMKKLSPLLAEPYFNEETQEVNTDKYEADTYLVKTEVLNQRFLAASSVKDAWDSKANTYIVHLTIFAVSLFLLGMATTISGTFTRWIFTGAGIVITLFGIVWMGVIYAAPVPDLRTCKTDDGQFSIDVYAEGTGLAYQNKHEEAIKAFTRALSCDPNYTAALIARGDAQSAMGNLEATALDYEKARATGDKSAHLAGELAWIYYLSGRFPDAIALNDEALSQTPDELWIRFNQGLALLASGKFEEAKKEYQLGMDSATRQVAQAKTEGGEPPSWLWWGLQDAADGLDDLLEIIAVGEGAPAPNLLADHAAIQTIAEEEISKLKSLSVALEFRGQPAEGELKATIEPFEFETVTYDEEGEATDYTTDELFPYGTNEVVILFDYAGMQDGQETIFKVYIDGEEDPSWRFVAPWELGESGSVEKPLSLAYSNTAVFYPGEYTVELYVDAHLAQRGFFMIVEEEE